MSACTFFGHRKCCGLELQGLRAKITELIRNGADTFYVGHQGQFDAMVYRCLKKLPEEYPHIRLCIVLAYLPTPCTRKSKATPNLPSSAKNRVPLCGYIDKTAPFFYTVIVQINTER